MPCTKMNASPLGPVIRMRGWLKVLAATAACMAGAAFAQPVADPASELASLTQRWLNDAITRTPASGAPLRMEVVVGELDPRLRLAPCARVEPYLPPGAKLWGRTRLGLRCVQGATNWNVFLPVTVKAFGPAWVLVGNVAPGTPLAAGDAIESEVDWASESAPVVGSPDLWVGQLASRQLVAGQALRQTMLRSPRLFQAGAQVKVVARGPGYAVAAAGQALTAAGAGETVRVRMDNGRILSGLVSENGSVEIAL